MPLGPIQTRPLSLGALLTLKTRGDMPRALLDDVRGSVDLERWWLRAKHLVWPLAASRSFVGAAPGAFYQWLVDSPVVPQNEWWYVRSASVVLTMGAAAPVPFSGCLAYFTPPTVPFRIQSLTSSFYSGVVAQNDGVMFTAHDVWLPPGAALGIWLSTLNASTTLTLTGFEYVPLSLNDG